jgi:hypothetical protein
LSLAPVYPAPDLLSSLFLVTFYFIFITMRFTIKFLAVASLIANTTYGRAIQQSLSDSSDSLGEGLQTRDVTFPLASSDQVLLEGTPFASGMLGGVKDIHILRHKNVRQGERVQGGQKLRILGVGDSITVGFLSDQDGGDGSGYRQALRDDLSSRHLPWYTLLTLY